MNSKQVVIVVAIIVIVAVVSIVVFLPLSPVSETTVQTKKLKVAAVFAPYIEQDEWDKVFYNGLMKAKATYGDKIQVDYTEKVADADWERVLRDYASNGYDLIFSHYTIMGEATANAARAFPNSWFVWTDGWPPIERNMVVITPLAHEASYLAGILAGGITKVGKIGVVGGMNVPSTYRAYYAFKLGVESVNPSAEIKLVWVGSFLDIGGGYDAAISLIDSGCDVIVGNGDSQNVGVRTAAIARNVWYIGGVGDESEYAPAVCLGSVLWALENAPVHLIGLALEDKLEEGKFYEYGLKEGADFVYNSKLIDVIPLEIRNKIDATRQEIISGTFTVPRKDVP